MGDAGDYAAKLGLVRLTLAVAHADDAKHTHRVHVFVNPRGVASVATFYGYWHYPYKSLATVELIGGTKHIVECDEAEALRRLAAGVAK